MKSNSNLVNAARQEDAFTDNGAVTNSTSLNNVLDLFFIAGASRTMTEGDIERMLLKAWTENPLLTVKVIFWAGDIRGGAGERRFFRIALKWLRNIDPQTFNKLFKFVPKYNRWDSLFTFQTPEVMEFIYNTLMK